MNTALQSDLLWALQPAPGWTVEQHTDALVLRAPTGDAVLRLTTFPTDATSAQNWIEAAAHFNRVMGRHVASIECGEFSGYVTEFRGGSDYHRGYTLRCADLPLDASYRCPESVKGRDDNALEAMLQTLTRRGRTA